MAFGEAISAFSQYIEEFNKTIRGKICYVHVFHTARKEFIFCLRRLNIRSNNSVLRYAFLLLCPGFHLPGQLCVPAASVTRNDRYGGHRNLSAGGRSRQSSCGVSCVLSCTLLPVCCVWTLRPGPWAPLVYDLAANKHRCNISLAPAGFPVITI